MKKLRHYFPPLLVLALVAAAATAQDPPPQLKLPEKLGPTVVKNFVKATAETDPNLKLINIDTAWKKTKGEGVILYVADTGVDLTHPEFKGVNLTAVNFTTDRDASDGNGHGTFCMSEIVGQQNVDGVAPKVDRAVMLKVLANNGSGSLDWLTKAIRYAIKDANGKTAVFSASLGASPMNGSDNPNTNPDLQAAILDGWKAGIVFTFAAGNDDSKLPPNSVGWPARYGSLPQFDGLIVVAACDLNRKITDFSSVGPATWTTTVGHDVLGALPNGQYGRWDGTSMATPISAGLACLWLSANRDVPAPERYKRYADSLRQASSFPTQRNPARGWGLPDAGKLLASTPPPGPGPQPPPATGGKVTITLDSLTPEARAALVAAGVTELSVTVGTTPAAPKSAAPAPTAPQPVPVTIPPATEIRNPVPGRWQPPAPPWYPPLPQQVPQYMPPGNCPGGVCPVPATQPSGWVPGQVIRRVLR